MTDGRFVLPRMRMMQNESSERSCNQRFSLEQVIRPTNLFVRTLLNGTA